jgi:hypothetical protein
MNVVKTSMSWDAQVREYPAPLCEVCSIPKWVNKRYLNSTTPLVALRIGYECRLCAAKNAAKYPIANPR